MVVERVKRDGRQLLAALLGRGERDRGRRREVIVDVLLMAALADGEAGPSDLDRIARAIQSNQDLSGLDWDQVLERLELVRKDAPLFSETRSRLVEEIQEPDARRFALSLAVGFLGSPLEGEEQALLDALADAFEVGDTERNDLLAPWGEADPFMSGFQRCAFNNPEAPRRLSLFEVMERTESDQELALLTFKLAATRVVMTRLSETECELAALGEVIDFGRDALRIDALLRVREKSWLVRCLAKDEALYPREHVLYPKLFDQMDSSASLYVVYADSMMAPQDKAFIKGLDPDRVVAERIEL